MPNRSLIASAFLAAVLALAPTARAEADAAAQAAGAALFKEGRALLEAGRYMEAAERFKAAAAVAPTVGTYLNLGDAYDKSNLTASATGAFRQAKILAGRLHDTEREEEADRRTKLLEPRLSNVVLDVAAANRGAGVAILEDGQPLPEGAWSTPIPMDPGVHKVEVSKEGKLTWLGRVTVNPGPGTTRLTVPALQDAPSDKPPDQGSGRVAPYWGPQRVAGVVAGSAGLVGLAVGAALGGVALSKASSLKSGGLCTPDLSACNAAGIPLRESAQTVAHGSTAALVVGGAAVVVGVVTFATAPSGSGSGTKTGTRVVIGPMAGVRTGGVLVRGGW
jgi:hypothetical protein